MLRACACAFVCACPADARGKRDIRGDGARRTQAGRDTPALIAKCISNQAEAKAAEREGVDLMILAW